MASDRKLRGVLKAAQQAIVDCFEREKTSQTMEPRWLSSHDEKVPSWCVAGVKWKYREAAREGYCDIPWLVDEKRAASPAEAITVCQSSSLLPSPPHHVRYEQK